MSPTAHMLLICMQTIIFCIKTIINVFQVYQLVLLLDATTVFFVCLFFCVLLVFQMMVMCLFLMVGYCYLRADSGLFTVKPSRVTGNQYRTGIISMDLQLACCKLCSAA